MGTIRHSPEEMADIVAARLALIREASGFETDIGRKVYRGRRSVSKDQAPCVTLIENSNDPGESPGRSLQYNVTQGYTMLAYLLLSNPEDQDNPNAVMHRALRDMKRAIWKPDGQREDPNLDGQCRFLHYTGTDMAPRDDGSILAVCALEIAVEYVEILA